MAINVLTPDYTKGFWTPLDALTKSLGVVKKTVLPYANPQNVDISGNVIPESPKVDISKLPVLPWYATMATPEEKPIALTGMGTWTAWGVPIKQAPVPIKAKPSDWHTFDLSANNRNITFGKSNTIDFSNIAKWPSVGLFEDEKNMYSKILNDWVSEDEAKKMLEDRRRAFVPYTELSPKDVFTVLRMQDEWVSSKDAFDMLNQKAQKAEAEKPLIQKIWENVLNVWQGATSLGMEQVWNLGSLIAKPFSEDVSKKLKEDVTKLEYINKAANESIGWQIGRKTFWIGEMVAATPAAVLAEAPATGLLSTMGGRMAAGAGVGLYQGAAMPILEKWRDVTAWDVAESAALWTAWGALAVPVAEKVIAPVLGKAIWYGTTAWKEWMPWVKQLASEDLQAVKNGFIKGMEGIDRATSFLDPAVKPLPTAPISPAEAKGETIGNKIAGWWSNKANRMIAPDIQKFEQMTGVKPWQWAIEHGMTDVGDPAVVKATQLWQDSMAQADKWLEAIAGKFSTKGQPDDVIGELVNANAKKAAARPRNADSGTSNSLKAKYDAEGLSMAEINEAKRIYARQHKYTWDQIASDEAVNSKDLQDAVRNWQFKTAEQNWLANLPEINKTTQWWKAYADMLWKSLSRKSANNSVSLTDWISLSGGKPENLAMFLGKKLGEKYVSPLALKTLTTQVKPAIVEPELWNIVKTNVLKDANYNLSGDLNTAGGESLVRKAKPLQLPAPSGELPSGNIVNVKPQEWLSHWVLWKANKAISGQVWERPIYGQIEPITETPPVSGSFREGERQSYYNGVKNLSDPEFKDIYQASKAVKKKFGDIDKNTMYNIAGVFVGGNILLKAQGGTKKTPKSVAK